MKLQMLLYNFTACLVVFRQNIIFLKMALGATDCLQLLVSKGKHRLGSFPKTQFGLLPSSRAVETSMTTILIASEQQTLDRY